MNVKKPRFHNSEASQPLSLGRNIIWNTVGCAINQGCVWAITVVVVVLSSGFYDSGILAYAMAIGNMFWPIGTYNMRTIQISDLKNELSSSEYVGFRIITVVMAYVLLTIYLLVTSSSLPAILATLAWLVYKADDSFVNVYYAIDQRAMRMDYIGKSQAIRGFITIGAFSVMLLAGCSVELAIVGLTIGCIAMTIFYDRPHASRLSSVKPSIEWSSASKLLKKYAPSVTGYVAFFAITPVSRQILEATCGEAALGIYAAMATPAAVIPFMAQFIYSPLLGNLSQLWLNRERKRLCIALAKIFGTIILVTIVSYVLSIFFGNQTLTFVYGSKAEGYTYLFSLALIATGLTTLSSFMFDMLLIVRSLKSLLASSVLALGISVLCTLCFIGPAGLNGVNFAIIAAYCFSFVLECLFLLGALKRS